MKPPQPPIPAHPAGEQPAVEFVSDQPVRVGTYAGCVHINWDPDAAVTPMSQMAFFIAFLKTSGLFDNLVAACPLHYASPNAPSKRDVLGTALLSVLAGHRRYAHITALRADTVNPPLLGMRRVLSEDAIRRAFENIEAGAGANCYKSNSTTPPAHCWTNAGSWTPTPRSNPCMANRKGLSLATIPPSPAARPTRTTAS
jgi:hypothetical protein